MQNLIEAVESGGDINKYKYKNNPSKSSGAYIWYSVTACFWKMTKNIFLHFYALCMENK